jgi:hypothetical protein
VVYEWEKNHDANRGCRAIDCVHAGMFNPEPTRHGRIFSENTLMSIRSGRMPPYTYSQFAQQINVAGLLRTATVAAALYGRKAPLGASVFSDGTHALLMDSAELEYASRHLGRDIARLLGAVLAYDTGVRAFRMAGKGAQLEQPTLIQGISSPVI